MAEATPPESPVLGESARIVDPESLARRIARASALAWVVGVLAMAVLSIGLVGLVLDHEVDQELRLSATAVYGLGWFEPDGRFESRHIVSEPLLAQGRVALTVLSTTAVVYGQPVPLGAKLRAEAMATEEEVWAEAGGLRLYALPMYDLDDVPVGAVVASVPLRTARGPLLQLGGGILAGALVFILVGLVVSRWVALRVLRALEGTLAEREQVLAGAAHELRTPMATLLAVLDATPPAELPAVHGELRQTVQRSRLMVERLLTWSRLAHGALPVEPLRLDLLVEVCLGEDDALEATTTVVEGDARLLEVAVRNLVENARNHGKGLARVVVREGRVEVWDRGGGLPAGHVVAPFTPGQRSRGSGLGLALVARIARRHGGQLQLRPCPTLVLPMQGEQVGG